MSQDSSISRRDLLRTATAGAVAVGASVALQPLTVFAKDSVKDAHALPTRPFGLTGENIPLFSLGGQGLLEIADHTDEAVAIINRAIDLGVKPRHSMVVRPRLKRNLLRAGAGRASQRYLLGHQIRSTVVRWRHEAVG